MSHRIVHGHICAGFLAQPQGGKVGHLGLTRVDDNQRGSVVGDGIFEESADNRMGFGGIGAGDDEALQIFHFGDGIAHSAGAKGQLQAGNAAGVTQPGAVINIVGAQHAAHQFLVQVVVFVGGFGAGVGGDRVRPVFLVEAGQLLGGKTEGLFPGGLAPVSGRLDCGAPAGQLACGADERRGQPVGVMHVISPKAPFNA